MLIATVPTFFRAIFATRQYSLYILFWADADRTISSYGIMFGIVQQAMLELLDS